MTSYLMEITLFCVRSFGIFPIQGKWKESSHTLFSGQFLDLARTMFQKKAKPTVLETYGFVQVCILISVTSKSVM